MNSRLFQLFWLLSLFFFPGCSGEPPETNGVRLRLRNDPTTLAPAAIVDVSGGVIAAKLFNGLIRIDENCNLVPDIALSWEIADNGLSYDFKLRSDIRYSNGRKVTASDFRRCYQQIICPETGSPRKWIFEKVKEFKNISDNEFRIILKEPFAPFLYLLCLPNAYLVSEDNLGTGPYVLSQWHHDGRLLLVANKNYFGGPPAVASLEYLIIPDDFSAKTEFEQGNIDLMEITADDWNRYHNSPAWPTYSRTGLNIYYFGFNCQDLRFRSRKFRQALNYAVDKKTIIKHLLQDQAEEAKGPVPPLLLPSALPGFPYLPHKAEYLLKQSGIKLDQPINVYVRAQQEAIRIAESVQHYLAASGIDTIIIPLEWSAFKEKVAKGQAELFLMSWWADYPSPENFLYPTFHSDNWGSGGNRARFKNIVIDKLIEQSQREMDSVKRQALYQIIQRRIVCQAPWLFLWHKNDLIVTQPWIKGVKLYPVYSSDKGTDFVKVSRQQSLASD